VLVIQAVGQSRTLENFDDIPGHMDNLETAIDGLRGGTANFIEYQITTTGNYQIGGNAYWAIVAQITMRSI
jgi:hypothetical protein